jgi:hypothetical protein
LNIALTGGNVVLTWPTNTYSLKYTLQGSSSLAPSSWSTVTNSPTASSNLYRVVVPANVAATFYRLKH